MSNPHVTASLAQGALVAGKYRLLKQLGEGAMGVVWSARNEHTSGQVALKLILGPGPDLRLRLLREAQACCKIQHKNVIQIHDVGQTDGGDPFLVMELLSGETLAALLERARRLTPSVAATIGRDVARALGAAHEKGIVHRDLKPANIFLHNQPGEGARVVKVLDFGVSKNLLATEGLRAMLGGPIGSPSYMSPEQARAERDIDARADIWSLGVVLFEMLTGERPFTGDSREVIDKIVRADIPLASRRVHLIEPGLEQLISACLTRDREQRLWPIAEVEKGLLPFTEDLAHPRAATLTAPWGAGAVASVPPSSRRLPVAALASEDPESDAETQKLEVAMLFAAPRARGGSPPRAILLPDVTLGQPDKATLKMPSLPALGTAGAPITRPLPDEASATSTPAPQSATAPLAAVAVSDPDATASPTASWTGPTPSHGDRPPPRPRAPFVARAVVAGLVAAVVLILVFTHRTSRLADPAPPAPTAIVGASPVEESAPADADDPRLVNAALPEVVMVDAPPPPKPKPESEAKPPPPRVAAPKPLIKCSRFVKANCAEPSPSR